MGSLNKKDFYFIAIQKQAAQGKSPYDKRFLKKLNCSKQRIQYYVRQLRQQGVIERIGFGVWKITGKKVKKSTRVGIAQYGEFFTSKNVEGRVRGHAFSVRLQLPMIRNWHKREDFLRRQEIPFKRISAGLGHFQRVKINGWKVWLCAEVLVFWAPEGFSVVDACASEVFEGFVNYVLDLFSKAEGLLRTSLKIAGKYKFKVTRSHYALMKNALAKLFIKHGKRLEVYDARGLWLLIDNSFNDLEELETVHPETSLEDSEVVSDFFNGLKKNPLTPSEILKMFSSLSDSLKRVAHNQEQFNLSFSKIRKRLEGSK